MAGAAILFLAAACNQTEPTVCTLEARAGLNLTVVDPSGLPVASAVAQASEGEYREVLQRTGPGVLFGVFERKGTYDVKVTAPGYKDWETRDVEVRADECHVIPVRLTVEMDRE